MNQCHWMKRTFCVALVVLLLLSFCALDHNCHRDHCPVCLLAAAFRLTLSLIFPVFGLSFLLQSAHFSAAHQVGATDQEGTLVALKVKLSD